MFGKKPRPTIEFPAPGNKTLNFKLYSSGMKLKRSV